jgi:hypothetical protein
VVGVTRYANYGPCRVCSHKAGQKIDAKIRSGAKRYDLWRGYPDLSHRDLSIHVLECILGDPKGDPVEAAAEALEAAEGNPEGSAA